MKYFNLIVNLTNPINRFDTGWGWCDGFNVKEFGIFNFTFNFNFVLGVLATKKQ